MDNETIIREFIAAWSRLDADELVSYFAADGIYYNMPIQPVQGHDALKEFIAGFISPWTSTEWEIVSLIASGDHVAVERIDRISAGDKQVDLPCVGIFEMEAGKIKVWRDYFDMNTYIKGMS
tara:strand:+ start:1830 stop:2195 length:366 start_codon:yes stop_codon:yes gene_type:complete